MKMVINKKYLWFVLALPFLATSCIKEKYTIDYGEDNTTRLITEFKTEGKAEIDLAVDAASGISVVNMTEVGAVSRSVVAKNYTVKVVVNNALITAYNTANGTSLVPAPSSALTFEALSFDLSKERRVMPVVARVNSTALTNDTYAVGLTISEVTDGEVSQLTKNLLIILSVKNAYDADYRSIGLRTNHGGPNNTFPITGTFPFNYIKRLVTVNANTCTMFTADNVDDMYITVNPDNSVTCSTNPLIGAFVTSNEGPCTYNPATRTFTLTYKYFNSSGNYRIITETLTRQ